MHVFVFVVVLAASLPAVPAGSDGIEVEGAYTRLLITPESGGNIEEFELLSTGHDLAGPNGLLEEGFGVGSFYAPNRRLNLRVDMDETAGNRPIVHLYYECDGPNIKGLRVQRTVEPDVRGTGFKVVWRIENEGGTDHWVAPWVRVSAAPGGSFDAGDFVSLAATAGVLRTRESRYYPAARNWAAATDPQTRESVCGIFDAGQLLALLTLHGTSERTGLSDAPVVGFQAAFVPFLLEAGTTWETTYHVAAYWGLEHIDFASQELAAQIDAGTGDFSVLLAGSRKVAGLGLAASVARAGAAETLEAKRFDLDPATLVRCTYDWQPSAAGSYELLGRVRRGGNPWPLGKDTHSPHGGIDTQFTTGGAPPLPLEPWTPAPFALDREPRLVEATPAARGDTQVWFANSMEKVFPDDRLVPQEGLNPKVRVELARGEHEAFQVVLRAPDSRPLTDITARLRGLAHDHAPQRFAPQDIKLFRVGAVPVDIPSHFETPTGRYPDPLFPLESFSIDAGTTAAIWVSLHARPGLEAGTYNGLLEITGGGLEPLDLMVEAEVFDFDLPRRPSLTTDFGWDQEAAWERCRAEGFTGSKVDLEARYLDAAAAHRVTLRQTAGLPPESPDYDRSLGRYTAETYAVHTRNATTISVPASLLDVPEQAQQAAAYIEEKDLTDRAFVQLADRPPRAAWPRLFERMQAARALMPEVRQMVTTHGLSPFLPDALDIWAVHLPVLDTANNKVILDRTKSDGTVWWFVNHEPSRPYGNFFVDFAGIEHRILFWQSWALGIRGMHYRSINALGRDRDPYTGLADVTPVNGDAFLVYPGPEGPVSSIRWEILRDGIEDYDYLVLFQEAARALAEKDPEHRLLEEARRVGNMQELVPDLVTFPREPSKLLAKRTEIGRLIPRLKWAAMARAPR